MSTIAWVVFINTPLQTENGNLCWNWVELKYNPRYCYVIDVMSINMFFCHVTILYTFIGEGARTCDPTPLLYIFYVSKAIKYV